MRIVIDMQGAQAISRHRGIGRYSLAIVQAMVRNRGDHEIILALNGLIPDSIEAVRAAFDGLLPQKSIRVWEAVGSVAQIDSANDWRRQSAQLIREAFLASLRPDLVLLTSLFEGLHGNAATSIGHLPVNYVTAVIVYDFIPKNYPEYYLKNPKHKFWYCEKIEYLHKADLCLAISDWSRKDALRHLGFANEYCVNISSGVESHFSQVVLPVAQKQVLREKYSLQRPFIMYTGGIDFRKNIEGLIRAYAKLPQQLRATHQLAIVCSINSEDKSRLERLGKNQGLAADELILTGFVPDADLVALYKLCALFVFPSWSEGFGLPLLEAMGCGAPVIAANTTSLPEVVGLPETLFDPYCDEAIAQAMTRVLSDGKFRQRLIEHGRVQVTKFSWDETARRAIQAMERVFAERTEKTLAVAAKCAEKPLEIAIANIKEAQPNQAEIVGLAAAIASSFPPKHAQNQLLVDISEFVRIDAKSGIQRVVRSILKEWLLNPPSGWRIEPVYATGEGPYRYARQFTARFLGLATGDLKDEVIDYAPGDIFFGLDFQAHLQIAYAGFYQQLRRHGITVKFLVFDLLPLKNPEYFPKSSFDCFQNWLRVVGESDGAICISKAVADELAEWMGVRQWQRLRPFTIEWNHLGSDIENSVATLGLPENAEKLLSSLKKSPSFLMVGTIEPRKGHAQVLDAFDQLWQSANDIILIIIGKRGWMVEDTINRLLTHPELGQRLLWPEKVSDEYLQKIYANSTCLITASYGEGFGLPLIEAAKNNVPVIARDIPVFREVLGECAYYFDGDSCEVLAQTIETWLQLYKNSDYPSTEGMTFPTWKESAERLFHLLSATVS